jgi:hypothetical protein
MRLNLTITPAAKSQTKQISPYFPVRREFGPETGPNWTAAPTMKSLVSAASPNWFAAQAMKQPMNVLRLFRRNRVRGSRNERAPAGVRRAAVRANSTEGSGKQLKILARTK